MEALIAHPDVDIIGCETIPRLDEASALCKMLTQKSNKPFYIGFSGHANGRTLASKEPIEYVVNVLKPYFENKNFWAFGLNGVSLKTIDGLLTRINHKLKSVEKGKRVPRLLVYPNSGESFSMDTYKWSDKPALDGSAFVDETVNWVAKHGVSVIGGCFRHTPEQMNAIHNKMLPQAKL